MKDLVKIIDNLRLENQELKDQLKQFEFQERDKSNKVDLKDKLKFPQSMWENQHPNPDKSNGEGGAEEFRDEYAKTVNFNTWDGLWSWCHSVNSGLKSDLAGHHMNQVMEEYSTSQMKKKAEETEQGWVILSAAKYIIAFTYSRTRKEAQEKWVKLWTDRPNWKAHYYKGIRCVKAERAIILTNPNN